MYLLIVASSKVSAFSAHLRQFMALFRFLDGAFDRGDVLADGVDCGRVFIVLHWRSIVRSRS